MSNNALTQRDETVARVIPVLLTILDRQDGGRVKADSVNDAADKVMAKMYKPGLLGRTHARRHSKMTGVIKAACRMEYVRYVQKGGSRLEITDRGRKKLEKIQRTRQRTNAAAA